MKKYIGGILFIIIAVIILTVGIILGVRNLSKNYEKITGTISQIIVDETYHEDGETKNDPTFYVNYNYNGKSYENVRLNYSDSFHEVGDKIDFYINVENPEEITIATLTPLYICIGLSSGFLTIGIIIIVKIKKSSRY